MKISELITALQEVQDEHGDIPVTSHMTQPNRNGPGDVKIVQGLSVESFWEFSDNTLCCDKWSSDNRIKALFIR